MVISRFSRFHYSSTGYVRSASSGDFAESAAKLGRKSAPENKFGVFQTWLHCHAQHVHSLLAPSSALAVFSTPLHPHFGHFGFFFLALSRRFASRKHCAACSLCKHSRSITL